MKAKLVTVALAIAVLCSVASAQDYFIQTGARINMRSWYSTNSRIVETVPSGTILQVVDKFNRWLKINRNGNEVWMANWVPYTRLQTEQVNPPEQSQQPSQPVEIDNLCFTVRTCRTDEEWAAGYFAFQEQQSASTSSGVTYVRNCTHARELGIAPIHRGSPLYRRALDRDNDGIGCEVSSPIPPVSSQPSGRVTYVRNCTHARQLGVAPIHRGSPLYRRALDRDNDGIGCE